LAKGFFKIIASFLIVAVPIIMGLIPFERVCAQEAAKGISPKNKLNPSLRGKSEGIPERNPFFLPPGVYLLSKSPTASEPKRAAPKPDIQSLPVSPPPLKVKAILFSQHMQLALIDQYILTVGDRIRDEKVLGIETDRVILGKGNQKRTLLLPQSHLPLTVDNP
jgi:hypothetical protein